MLCCIHALDRLVRVNRFGGPVIVSRKQIQMAFRVIFYTCCWMLLFACASSPQESNHPTSVQYETVGSGRIDLSLGRQHVSLIPASLVFQQGSSSFSSGSATVLDPLLLEIKHQGPHWVSIMVVNRFSGSTHGSALAAQRADALVHYFSAAKLDVRMVYAKQPKPHGAKAGMPGIQYFSDVKRDIDYIEVDYGH